MTIIWVELDHSKFNGQIRTNKRKPPQQLPLKLSIHGWNTLNQTEQSLHKTALAWTIVAIWTTYY